jgi:hypothetical protein
MRYAILHNLVTAILPLALFGCGPRPTPPAPSPFDPYESVVSSGPHDPSACPAACAAYVRFGCPEGETSPGGITCLAFCKTLESDEYMPTYAACASRATTLEALHHCNVRCVR